MHRTACRNGSHDRLVKLRQRQSLRASYRLALRRHCRLRAHPDDVIYVYIIAIKALVSAVKVQHSGKPRLIYAPVIDEVAVLTEFVVITAVVHRSIDIAEEHSDTPVALRCPCRHLLQQHAASVYVYFRFKHILVF